MHLRAYKKGLNLLCYLYCFEETENAQPGELEVLGHQLSFQSKQNFRLYQLGGGGFFFFVFWISAVANQCLNYSLPCV